MSKEKRTLIASLGGKAVSQDKEHMRRIGKIGGLVISSNREHMSRIASAKFAKEGLVIK